MSTYKLLNGSTVDLSKKQETFVKRALEMLPEIKKSGVITRKQAFEVYASCNVGHPKWLKNLKLHAERGSYYLPLEMVADASESEDEETEMEDESKEESSEQAPGVDSFEEELRANGIV